jgi:hypothetical protein
MSGQVIRRDRILDEARPLEATFLRSPFIDPNFRRIS